MNCSNASKLISLVIDGEASEYQRRLLDFHLLGCSSCRKAMSMCRDISQIAGKLPAPIPPADLELNIREMLKTNIYTGRTEHRFRNALLTFPAVAALLIITIAVLPLSTEPESITDTQGIAMAVHESKNADIRLSLKSGIRTAPLSDYSRQASLISF
ncbi:MAG: zf-HC2 domain-containing protein [Candidatus Fermentibacteria bacterium]